MGRYWRSKRAGGSHHDRRQAHHGRHRDQRGDGGKPSGRRTRSRIGCLPVLLLLLLLGLVLVVASESGLFSLSSLLPGASEGDDAVDTPSGG